MTEEPGEYEVTVNEDLSVDVEPKANRNVALVGLITVTLIGAGAMAAALIAPIFFSDLPEVETEVLSGLNNLALLGLGALSALLGGKNGK